MKRYDPSVTNWMIQHRIGQNQDDHADPARACDINNNDIATKTW